ncbi:MAG: hypothetical protein NT023_01665 [Armatimonadetes bacterium]|nr:hypothetical protein [Armatimonadota bacterium]
MSESSQVQEPEEEVLDAPTHRAFQEVLISQNRTKAGDRMNERILVQVAMGHELDSWTTQLLRRLKWMALPLIGGFVVCAFGLQWQESRRLATYHKWQVRGGVSGQPAVSRAPIVLPPPISVGKQPSNHQKTGGKDENNTLPR